LKEERSVHRDANQTVGVSNINFPGTLKRVIKGKKAMYPEGERVGATPGVCSPQGKDVIREQTGQLLLKNQKECDFSMEVRKEGGGYKRAFNMLKSEKTKATNQGGNNPLATSWSGKKGWEGRYFPILWGVRKRK